jgi:hypothetical protein
MNFKLVLFLASTLFLGGFMIYGGVMKFSRPLPAPTSQIEKYEKEGMDKARTSSKLVISNYIFGLKQSGYFWQMLGFCELFFGLLIISQVFSFLGALMTVPISLNIFLFNAILKPDDLGDFVLTLGLFVANLIILVYYYPKWKHLVKDSTLLKSYQAVFKKGK